MTDQFEVEVLRAEVQAAVGALDRLERQNALHIGEEARLRSERDHQLAIKRSMHATLDALYRRTKAERDFALGLLAEGSGYTMAQWEQRWAANSQIADETRDEVRARIEAVLARRADGGHQYWCRYQPECGCIVATILAAIEPKAARR